MKEFKNYLSFTKQILKIGTNVAWLLGNLQSSLYHMSFNHKLQFTRLLAASSTVQTWIITNALIRAAGPSLIIHIEVEANHRNANLNPLVRNARGAASGSAKSLERKRLRRDQSPLWDVRDWLGFSSPSSPKASNETRRPSARRSLFPERDL